MREYASLILGPFAESAEPEAAPWWSVWAEWTPHTWRVRVFHDNRANPSILLKETKSHRRAISFVKNTADAIRLGEIPWHNTL